MLKIFGFVKVSTRLKRIYPIKTTTIIEIRKGIRHPQDRKFSSVNAPDKKTTIENMFSSIKNVLAGLPKKEVISQAVVKKVISLEKVMDNLANRMQSALSLSFKEFAGVGKRERVEVVVGFLAMLELVKQGVIDVAQEGSFNDISMESKEVGVPKYI